MRSTLSQIVLLSFLLTTPLLSGCVREMSHLALYMSHDKCGDNKEACEENGDQKQDQKQDQKTTSAPVKKVEKK